MIRGVKVKQIFSADVIFNVMILLSSLRLKGVDTIHKISISEIKFWVFCRFSFNLGVKSGRLPTMYCGT